jgi:integrase/recombinase XerC
LLRDTGIRLSECATLTPAHVYAGFVRVVGKGDKERLCPLTDEVASQLMDWLKVRVRQGELPHDSTAKLIFQLTNHGVAQVIERLAKAMLMLRRRTDLYTVKTILGHSSITTTEGYLALCPEDIRAKHATGSPFLALTAMLPPEPTPLAKKRWYR